MNVVCKNEVFKLHGLADKTICVVMEDIKATCAFLRLRWSGPQVGFYVSSLNEEKGEAFQKEVTPQRRRKRKKCLLWICDTGVVFECLCVKCSC